MEDKLKREKNRFFLHSIFKYENLIVAKNLFSYTVPIIDVDKKIQ